LCEIQQIKETSKSPQKVFRVTFTNAEDKIVKALSTIEQEEEDIL